MELFNAQDLDAENKVITKLQEKAIDNQMDSFVQTFRIG